MARFSKGRIEKGYYIDTSDILDDNKVKEFTVE